MKTRYEKFEALKNHPIEKKLFNKIGPFEQSFIDLFMYTNYNLDTNDWAEKVNRLFINDSNKPRNHKEIWAVLINIK